MQVQPATCWSACIICSTVLTVAVFVRDPCVIRSLDASYCSSHCILYLSGLGFGHSRAERDAQDYLCFPGIQCATGREQSFLCEIVPRFTRNNKNPVESSSELLTPIIDLNIRSSSEKVLLRGFNSCQLTDSDLESSSPN